MKSDSVRLFLRRLLQNTKSKSSRIMRASEPNTMPAIAPALKEVSLLLENCEGSEGISPALVLAEGELDGLFEDVLSLEAIV